MTYERWYEVSDPKTRNLLADFERRWEAVAYRRDLGDPGLEIHRVVLIKGDDGAAQLTRTPA